MKTSQDNDLLWQALSMETERLRKMDSCPCSAAGGNKNFLKKNKETVGNTFLIKNHIYKNLYSWDLSIFAEDCVLKKQVIIVLDLREIFNLDFSCFLTNFP